MRIQAPGPAVEAYERAYDFAPSNAELASKIGEALTATHDYSRAADYYNQSLSNGLANIHVKLGMARLHAKINKSGCIMQVWRHQAASDSSDRS